MLFSLFFMIVSIVVVSVKGVVVVGEASGRAGRVEHAATDAASLT